ncbi:hypothetical protein MBLNU13_g10024t1 [Cladosporium sp. NU13]
MRFTTFFLSHFLAITALAVPLLAKRQRGLYTIDGEPTTFHLDHDKNGKIIPPADFPHYDSLDMQCEAHKNYVPRIGMSKWQKECPSKIFQWKIDHNVFESRELAAEAKASEEERKQIEEQEAAEAKANEEQRKQNEEQELQDMLRDCKRTPETFWCRMLLPKKKDAKYKKEKEAQEGNGGKEAVA